MSCNKTELGNSELNSIAPLSPPGLGEGGCSGTRCSASPTIPLKGTEEVHRTFTACLCSEWQAGGEEESRTLLAAQFRTHRARLHAHSHPPLLGTQQKWPAETLLRLSQELAPDYD
ncbi:UNVERIFIED_CONTAM: hypothetical protein K2H54_000450 [Gekko kuhli]